ncbi:MAG: glycoside hydrolase [Chloroflexota bacterium]
MTRGRLVVHAHFYQPTRIDPFTGDLPPDPAAAPYRDWNARITAECYRPNAETGALAHASWDLGPTLSHYLADAAPDVLAGFAEADRRGGGADAGPGIAQAFHHAILPFSALHDRRTEIRWGLRDFEVRFGRPATAIWFPETAIDLATLRVAVECGVKGTILAPWQADAAHLERRAYRVDVGDGRHIAAAFYDGDLSGSVSFDAGLTSDAAAFARERIAPRLASPLSDGSTPTIVIASDGELYGHHQHVRDLFLRALVDPAPDAPDRGFDVVTLASLLDEPEGRPFPEIRIRERTSWSCHHGVLRWGGECPDVHDGRWKAPLRGALDRLAGAIDTITEAFAAELPGLTTSGTPATGMSTWCSAWSRPRTTGRQPSAREAQATTAGAWPPSSRRSAGAWPCSPRMAGTGRSDAARDGAEPARGGARGADRGRLAGTG